MTSVYVCDTCTKSTDSCPLLVPLCMESVYWIDLILPQVGCASHSAFNDVATGDFNAPV
jgi:hypothetical protein